MKRNDDMLRELLLAAEASEKAAIVIAPHQQSPILERQRHFHALLLCDAGYMEQTSKDVFRLTAQGYDFLDAIRSETRWKKTKEAAEDAGGMALGMMKDLALAYLKQEAAKRLGIEF